MIKYFKNREFFITENGSIIRGLTLAYKTYGDLSDKKDNAILIFHALTGDMNVDEWWSGLIGSGKFIDTDKYFIICANTLGGCYGSTGPSSINPITGTYYGADFPRITIRDMVSSQKMLIDYLGIKKLKLVMGGSMGGLQTLQWAVSFPEMSEKIVAMACSHYATAQNIAYNLFGIEAIKNDKDWLNGRYYGKTIPYKGLSLARMIGVTTYKSDELFKQRFGRRFQSAKFINGRQEFSIESYLKYQGQKLVNRFDPNSYITLMEALNTHDISYEYDSMDEAVSRIQSDMLLVSIDEDIIYPAKYMKDFYDFLITKNKKVTYKEVHSIQGHDGFLVETESIIEILKNFWNG